MNSAAFVKTTLWITFPFNMTAAYALAFPSSFFGQLAGLPQTVDPIYAGFCAFFVASYGFMYAWLASQPSINQQLLFVGAAGKSGVILVAVGLWLVGSASGQLLVLTSVDLVFATLWFRWLYLQRAHG
jgi:hypothetical protein